MLSSFSSACPIAAGCDEDGDIIPVSNFVACARTCLPSNPREKGQSLWREMGDSQLITDKVAVLLLPLAAAVMTNALPEQQ